MRVYVAAGFAAYERVRALKDFARSLGHEVSHDWTRTDSFGEDGHPLSPLGDRERYLDLDVQQKRALEDIRGVRESDLLILLADTNPYGGLMETGMALLADKEVWVVAGGPYSIFWTLPQVTVLRDDDEVRLRLRSDGVDDTGKTVAFTLGHAEGYDARLSEPTPLLKAGAYPGYPGGWVWATAEAVRDFRDSFSWKRSLVHFGVYELKLPNGWDVDVSPKPDPSDGVHRLLRDAPIVRRVDA